MPKEIINKPGKLDAREWEIMTTHTTAGQEMLDRIGGFMRKVGLIVRSHHERWDGGGYPDGLAGEEIPLEARIIACCDSWSAMRTDRSYRKRAVLRGRAGRDRRQLRAPVRPAGRRGVPEDHRAQWRAGPACGVRV